MSSRCAFVYLACSRRQDASVKPLTSLDDRTNQLHLWQLPSSPVRRRLHPVIHEERDVKRDSGPGIQRLQRTGAALGDDEVLVSTTLKRHAAQLCLHGRASSCRNLQLHLRAPMSTHRNSFRDAIRWTSNSVSECRTLRVVRHSSTACSKSGAGLFGSESGRSVAWRVRRRRKNALTLRMNPEKRCVLCGACRGRG